MRGYNGIKEIVRNDFWDVRNRFSDFKHKRGGTMEELDAEVDSFVADRDSDIYTDQGVCDCFEDDEINPREEGFMRGYLGA